ncbi:hypothetical protein Tco_1444618, partial [Tanacetum coccineum]
MEAMKIIPELAPREIVRKTSTYLPLACYTMSKAEKTKFCQCLSEDKVPFGCTFDDNELALVDPPKRKKGGPAKLKEKPTEPFKVKFDKNGRAIEQDQKDALWESIKKKRAIGKAYDKQQTNYAHIGRSGYRGMDVDLSKVEL